MGKGGEKSFAQQLANELNVEVTAPDKNITVSGKNGTPFGLFDVPTSISISSPKEGPGTWQTFKPKIKGKK